MGSQKAKPKRIEADFKRYPRFKYIDSVRVKNPDILLLFVRWHATLQKDRNPLTQKDFAKRYAVSEDALADWKRLDGFWDEVKEQRPQQLRKLTIKIDLGLAKAAMAGNPKAVELWHKLYEGYNEKIRLHDDTPPRTLSPELQKKLHQSVTMTGLASLLKVKKIYKEDNLNKKDSSR